MTRAEAREQWHRMYCRVKKRKEPILNSMERIVKEYIELERQQRELKLKLLAFMEDNL